MVIERAELPIAVGREQEFEQQFMKAGQLLRAAAGCRAVSLARGIESPSQYLLLIEWDSIEAHQTFTATAEMGQVRNLIGPFFTGKPNTGHFAPLNQW
jgi:heme-degrading monooxygenase HmoA